MVPQRMRLVLMLYVLLAWPADAQDEAVFAGSPMDFLPLEVGNQWTYEHGYGNLSYELRHGFEFDYFDPVEQLAYRLRTEIPGYPVFVTDFDLPPEDLLYPDDRELTLEITHTETIEGHEYFVFSEPPYDWPPVPTLCLVGQKVRFSDDGVLLVRQLGQDIPLYDFSQLQLDTYTAYDTPAFPVLYDNDAQNPVWLRLSILRHLWDTRAHPEWWSSFFPPPLSFGPAFATEFGVHVVKSTVERRPRTYGDVSFSKHPLFGWVAFVANYGLVNYYVAGDPGYGWAIVFENEIRPVSAVIGGEEIAYPNFPYGGVYTSVQPTSWAQLKARHGQRP